MKCSFNGERHVKLIYLLYSMLYYCDYFVTFLVGGLGERALVFLVSF